MTQYHLFSKSFAQRKILGAYGVSRLKYSQQKTTFPGHDPAGEREAFLAEFSTSVLSGRHISARPSVTHQVPASWWQYFKQDRFPLWAKKRWPVRYEKLTGMLELSQDIIYPYADYIPAPLGDFGIPVIYESWEFSGPGIFDPGKDRFIDDFELVSDFTRWLYREKVPPYEGDAGIHDWGTSDVARFFLEWLQLSGVNVSELVLRGNEKRPS